MKTRKVILSALLTAVFLASAAFAAEPSEFDGPPIEHDTLKKNPDARFKKIWDQMKDDTEGKNTPADIIAHLADYRKMFWETYPDKPGHEEAREAFAQALFIKDLHYLQSDIWLKNVIDVNTNRTPTNPNLHSDTPANAVGQAIGQIYTGAAIDGSINPDGGISQTALPEFEDWVNAARKALGPLTKKSNPDDVFATTFKTGLGMVSADFRKACDLSGKEYQAYLIERDWAEYDKANIIPTGFDNKQHYGIYLYFRNAQIPLHEAKATYADMVAVLGQAPVESAVERVRTAPKTPDKKLFTRYPAPFKLAPGGTKIPDYDIPMPKDISDFFTNQLVEMEALATQSDTRAYLLCLLKTRYFINQQHNFLKPTTTKWSFAQSTYKALCNAFGEQQVLSIAEKIRTAPKRQVGITIMDPDALGALRNDPLEAFEDIITRSDLKGYVKAALAFNQNIDDPGSVDVDAAYKKFLATTGAGDEKNLLEAAKRCTVGDRIIVYKNPRYGARDEIIRIQNELASPTAETPLAVMIPDPDYLAWKKFPDNVKVSYIIRGWNHEPRNPDHFTGPAAPSERYTLSVKSRTPDLLVLWNTEIVYDYPSGIAHPPHDMEIGYGPTRPRPTTREPAKAGTVNPRTGKTIQPAEVPTTDSGEETLNVAGRSIPTRWTSATRTSGSSGRGLTFTSITKIWTSDEIPGGLVRKTDETISTSGTPNSGSHQLRETVLESFQGFTPGTPAAANAPPPAGPTAPAVTAATQPAAVAPTVAPAPAPPVPVAPPAPVAKKKITREPVSPAEAAAQKEIMKRYYAATQRNLQMTVQLAGNRRRNDANAPKFPPEISKARTDMETELSATLLALNARDTEEAQKQIQSAEDNLTLIEKYLETKATP